MRKSLISQIEIQDKGYIQEVFRRNEWLFPFVERRVRNPFRQINILLETTSFSSLVVFIKGVGFLVKTVPVCFSRFINQSSNKSLPLFPKKVTLRVTGVGWRYWLKQKRSYFKFRVNHSFKVKFYVPVGFQLTKINRYFFRFQFWEYGWLNQVVSQLIRIQPTYTYKDIGIRPKNQLPRLKKLQKKLY